MKTNRITTHPGIILLEDFLKPYGIAMNALAVKLRVANPHIWQVCRGKRAVTPPLALRLARFFGNSPEFWLNLQLMYDLSLVKSKIGETVEREVFPLKETQQ